MKIRLRASDFISDLINENSLWGEYGVKGIVLSASRKSDFLIFYKFFLNS